MTTHKFPAVIKALLKNNPTLQFNFLLVQEPPTNLPASKPISEPNWHIIEPAMSVDYVHTDDSHTKSVIYLDKSLPS